MEVREHGLYIAGKSVPASANETADVLDPATNRPFARVASGTRDDVNAAVEAARAAFNSPEWRDLGPGKRGRLLLLPGAQGRGHFEELLRLQAPDGGQPLRGGEGGHADGFNRFEYYCRPAEQ